MAPPHERDLLAIDPDVPDLLAPDVLDGAGLTGGPCLEGQGTGGQVPSAARMTCWARPGRHSIPGTRGIEPGLPDGVCPQGAADGLIPCQPVLAPDAVHRRHPWQGHPAGRGILLPPAASEGNTGLTRRFPGSPLPPKSRQEYPPNGQCAPQRPEDCLLCPRVPPRGQLAPRSGGGVFMAPLSNYHQRMNALRIALPSLGLCQMFYPWQQRGVLEG